MGHSYTGQITHDVSHYFQSETPDPHSRHHLNTTGAFKSLSIEQIMSSDHPPYKRDGTFGAAVAKTFELFRLNDGKDTGKPDPSSTSMPQGQKETIY